LNHRRGVAIVGVAALLTCGVGLAPAFSSTPVLSGAGARVFSGCLATHGDRELFDVVRGPKRRNTCPAGSFRVSWNAKGRSGAIGASGPAGANGTTGADGSTGPVGATGSAGTTGTDGSAGIPGPVGPAGADGVAGTNGANGAAGASGADGTNGADGQTGPAGPAGPGSLVSSGVFTLLSPGSYPDTHAYLPLSGYLATEFVAPPLDQDSEFTWAAHTSVEQVIGQDETITNIHANFGSITDLGGRLLRVELTLLVSSGGTALLSPAVSCMLDVEGQGPTSLDCALTEDQAVHLRAGDVAVMYVHPYVGSSEPNTQIDIYGTVALTL
jgi:hypothetical protein